jgi:hypothetical protein
VSPVAESSMMLEMGHSGHVRIIFKFGRNGCLGVLRGDGDICLEWFASY